MNANILSVTHLGICNFKTVESIFQQWKYKAQDEEWEIYPDDTCLIINLNYEIYQKANNQKVYN